MKRNINSPKLNINIFIVTGFSIHKLSGIHSSPKKKTAEKREQTEWKRKYQ